MTGVAADPRAVLTGVTAPSGAGKAVVAPSRARAGGGYSADNGQPDVPCPYDGPDREKEVDAAERKEFRCRGAAMVKAHAKHPAHHELRDKEGRQDRALPETERQTGQHAQTEKALGGCENISPPCR